MQTRQHGIAKRSSNRIAAERVLRFKYISLATHASAFTENMLRGEQYVVNLPLKVADRSLTRQRVFRACWRAQAHPLTGENFRNGFSAVSRWVLAQVDMRQNPPNIQEIANSTRYQRLVYTLPKKIIPVVEQMVVGIDLPTYVYVWPLASKGRYIYTGNKEEYRRYSTYPRQAE